MASLASHGQDAGRRGRVAQLDTFIRVLDQKLEPSNYRPGLPQKSTQTEVLAPDRNLGPDL